MHVVSLAMLDRGRPASGADIPYPWRTLAEHRDDIALAVVLRQHDRDRSTLSRAVAGRLERDEKRRRETHPCQLRPQSGDRAAKTIRSPFVVEQAVAAPVEIAAQIPYIGSAERRESNSEDG
jgi:hypothetical protein